MSGSLSGRCLHRTGRQYLHEVIDHHVAQGTDRVVEPAAAFHPEVLRHGDLHRLDVVAVPDRFDDGVGETQVEQLFQAHLAEEMVHPVDVLLVKVLVQVRSQRPGRGEVVPERLLHHDARVVAQAGVGQVAHHPGEQVRRDLQVEQRPVRALDHRTQPVVGVGIGEVAGHIGHPAGQSLERVRVDLFAGVLDRVTRMLAQVVGAPVLRGNANNGAVQQPAPLQPVQGSESHLPGQVTGDAEDHKDVG